MLFAIREMLRMSFGITANNALNSIENCWWLIVEYTRILAAEVEVHIYT